MHARVWPTRDPGMATHSGIRPRCVLSPEAADSATAVTTEQPGAWAVRSRRLILAGGVIAAFAFGVLLLLTLVARPAGASQLTTAAPRWPTTGASNAPSQPATLPLPGSGALPPAPTAPTAPTPRPVATDAAPPPPAVHTLATTGTPRGHLPSAAGQDAEHVIWAFGSAGGRLVQAIGTAIAPLPDPLPVGVPAAPARDEAASAPAPNGSETSAPGPAVAPSSLRAGRASGPVIPRPVGDALGVTRPGSPAPSGPQPPPLFLYAPAAQAVLDSSAGTVAHGGSPGTLPAVLTVLAVLAAAGAALDPRRHIASWVDSPFSPPG